MEAFIPEVGYAPRIQNTCCEGYKVKVNLKKPTLLTEFVFFGIFSFSLSYTYKANEDCYSYYRILFVGIQ